MIVCTQSSVDSDATWWRVDPAWFSNVSKSRLHGRLWYSSCSCKAMRCVLWDHCNTVLFWQYSCWVVLRSLSGKFCVWDEVAFLSLREQSLMYWSSVGVFTFALPDRALDAADPVSAKCFRVLRTRFCRNLRSCHDLLRKTIWLLTFSRCFDDVFPTVTVLLSKWSSLNVPNRKTFY